MYKTIKWGLIVFVAAFMLTWISDILVADAALIHVSDEIGLFHACSYYNLTDFDKLTDLKKTTLKTAEIRALNGSLHSGVWQWSINGKWADFDDFNKTFIKMSVKTQYVRYCADITRQKTKEGYVISVDIIPEWDSVIYSKLNWWNGTIKYKSNLTQINTYPDAFLAGSNILTFNVTQTEVWCDSPTPYLYFNNDTGKDVYCVNSTETGTTGTNLVNTSFPNTGNPWDKDALMILHLNGTDAYDASIYHNPWVSTAGTPVYVKGIIGIGLNFSDDGAGQSIDFGDINSMDGLSALTVMAWFCPRADNNNGIVGKATTGATGWAILTSPTDMSICADIGSWQCADTTDLNPAVGECYHIVGTYDGETLRLYVNGTERINNAAPSGSIDASSDTFKLGRNGASSYECDGMVDEVRIYNRTMNATEINQTFWSQNLNFRFSTIGSVENSTYVEPVVVPPNITLNSEIKYCYDGNYLFKRTKDVADNGTAVFNTYLVYCNHGCSNITLLEFGRPGCKASEQEQFIILIVISAILIISLRWVIK
jgi:hypothetical protein